MILLDPYASRSCPVKIQHEFDPLRTTAPDDEGLRESFTGGKLFETQVLDEICAARPDLVTDLRNSGLGTAERELATRVAVERGDWVIIGPTVPIDPVGHRRGHPDVLVRDADRPDGRPGYLPVECKRHLVLEQGSAEHRGHFSRLSEPLRSASIEVAERSFRSSRDYDLMQMAHYWRLLEAAGWSAPGDPTAGVIGTDVVPGVGSPVIAWVSLTAKLIRTFSRTSELGWKRRGGLERYDHEHNFRVKVATQVSRRTGAPDDPPLMVNPVVVPECASCQWWELCRVQLNDDDLSLRISKSPLDVREINVLRTRGVHTIHDLAGADIDALLVDYLPEVRHRHGAEGRLRLAARRANLMLTGRELDRLTDGPIDVPEASLEIDFDIETSRSDQVYLWGFLVHDRTSVEPPRYVSFARFDDLTRADEIALAHEAMGWLADLVAERPDAAVYHYSDYEILHIGKLLGRQPGSLGARLLDRQDLFVDMFTLVRDNFFGANGLGLKVVAHTGAGFEWRDANPGGLNSQLWFDDAVRAGSERERNEARERVLAYNEDDVRATHALRAWLRTLS